jgi:translocation and assembly module TamA
MFSRSAIILNPRKLSDHNFLSGDPSPIRIPCIQMSRGMLKLCLLATFFGWLSISGLTMAQSDNVPAVKLIAPEPVREVLEKYFPLPDALIKNENERAIFMRSAQREIADLLSTEGYFTAKAVLRSVTPEGVLELEVIPGPRTAVSEVNIELRGDLSLHEAKRMARVQQLRAAWLLQPGKPFRAAAWDEAKADLLAKVASEDYAAARLVQSSAQVNAGEASASLHVVIDSGPRYLFGELQVSGLERYEELLVSRYATFSSGQPYRRDLLLSFQTKLQNLRQFSTVIVNLDTASGYMAGDASQGAATAPVKVHVVEALSRKVSIGIGYSSNNGMRSGINYESYNFLNRAWILSGAVVVEQNRQTVSAGLAAPPNPVGYQFKWAGSAERTQIQGLETRTNKLSVIRGRTLFDIETGIGPYWQQEQQIPEGGVRQTAQALVIDWYWNRRRVDNPLSPMSGSLTQVRLGGAAKSLLSDQDFVRSYLRYQKWIPLAESDVLLLRIEGGYTAATSSLGIPQDYLFRVGGTQTVRGFAYQSLGVHDGDAVVGGRVMATTSAEYTHWFGKWGAALFCDAGGAADTAPELRMSLGYGVGARWRSPVGPLALDFARGKGQPGSRIHFSIAVAF